MSAADDSFVQDDSFRACSESLTLREACAGVASLGGLTGGIVLIVTHPVETFGVAAAGIGMALAGCAVKAAARGVGGWISAQRQRGTVTSSDLTLG